MMYLLALAALVGWSVTPCSLSAQNQLSSKQWETIRQDTHYLIGWGQASDIDEARQKAMSDLAGKISSKVITRFDGVITNTQKGSSLASEQQMKNIIQTYSSVTLNNVAEYVVKEHADYVVYRYMKDSELSTMFHRRAALAKKWAREAAQRRSEGKIGDALQAYYWSLALLRSCPDADLETMEQGDGEANMTQAVYQSVKDILRDVTVKATSVAPDGAEQRVTLAFSYGGQPVANFNYKTCDKQGTNCGEVYTAKDGVGELVLPRGAKLAKQKVWAEYEFRDEANIHPELQAVMESTQPVPFRAAELGIDTSGCQQAATDAIPVSIEEMHAVAVTNSTMDTADTQAAMEAIKAVSKGMAAKSYDALRDNFTPEGWDMFGKLIRYGNATVLTASPKLELTPCGEYMVCRSLPMSFAFKGNKRTFTEDVVFYLNRQGKICEVAFGLDAASVSDIMGRGGWDDQARYVMIHFLETYKTAYALKRLDYISSIFSNDALIITGSIVKSAGSGEIGPKKLAHVKYTRQTKEEYMNSLRRCFASNEYINLHFGDNIVRRSEEHPNVYGIQIKQDYFSSSYGDTGYLFLLIDFKKPQEPLIHVRAWQPDKDPNIKDGRIGINDFFL